MGSIKNAFKFIFSPTASRTTGILIILVIAATVPLTVLVAQKQQELRQHAEGNNCTVTVNLPSGNPPWTIGYSSGATPISTVTVPSSYTFYNVSSGQYSFTVTDGDLQTSTITANADCPATAPTSAPAAQTAATPIPTPPCATYYQDGICVTLPTTVTTITVGCTAVTNITTCQNLGCTWYNNSYCDKSPTQPTPTPTPFNCSQSGYGCYPPSEAPNGIPLAAGYKSTTCDTPNTGLVCYQLVSTPTSAPIPPTSTPISTPTISQQPTSTPPVQKNVPSVIPTSSLTGDFDGNGCIGTHDYTIWQAAYIQGGLFYKKAELSDFNTWYIAMLNAKTSGKNLCNPIDKN